MSLSRVIDVNSSMTKGVFQFLKELCPPFEIIDCGGDMCLVEAIKSAKIAPEDVIKAVPLATTAENSEYLLAIVPFYSSVDLKLISQLFGKKYHLVSNKEATMLFDDCDEGSYPPFADIYRMQCVVDEQLFDRKDVIFQSGSNQYLIKMAAADFNNIIKKANSAPIASVNAFNAIDELSNSSKGSTINDILSTQTSAFKNEVFTAGMVTELTELVDPNKKLPHLPLVATQLINYLSDPFATPSRIIQSISSDAQLSSQVLRYARATCFTHSEKIDCLDEAVNKALGMDLVSCIALSIASSKSFRTPRKGPIGYIALWRHAMYSATLMHALARRIPNIQLRPSTAYLVGFTHKYGMFALGHMFQFKYQTLNKLIETQANPTFSGLRDRSKQLGPTLLALNSGHAALGAWLMAEWQMPDAVITAVGEHLTSDYSGDFCVYVHLAQLSDLILQNHGIACGIKMENEFDKSALLRKLGIAEDIVKEVTKQVFAGNSEIECLATRLAA